MDEIDTDEIRIIVAGSRTFQDFSLLCRELDALLSQYPGLRPVIVSGGARGADSLGIEYASLAGCESVVFPAKWDLYGKSAGFIRNQEMLRYACSRHALPFLVAFWDGESKGTSHMIRIAAKEGVQSKVIKF